MYGEIHRYALHTHHDMHAFPGTHALLGGAEYCITPVLSTSSIPSMVSPRRPYRDLSIGEYLLTGNTGVHQ